MRTLATKPGIWRARQWLTGSLLCLVPLASPAEEPNATRSAPILSALSANNPRRTAIVDVVERLSPCVVNIHSERTLTKGNKDYLSPAPLSAPIVSPTLTPTQNRVNGMGTGIIIDHRGYIITNHHVVDDVQLLRVRLADGNTYPARVIAREPEADLAIIKIDAPKSLPTVPIGTASDLRVGETVIAIGNAFGYEHTVSTGIVSALKRDVNLNRDVSYRSLIQTDASINPGNSGGPLLNINGELVGVNVAIRAGAQGIGFALPIDNVLKSAADMMSVRRRTGLVHGLVVRNEVDTEAVPTRRWTVVERVDGNSAAGRAGIQVGDILDKVGDLKILTSLDLERALYDRTSGDRVAMTARRGATVVNTGTEVKGELAFVAVDKAVAVAPTDVVWKKLGMRGQSVTGESVTKVNPQLHGGLMLTDVAPESAAAKAGFLKGDILIGLHQWETISTENVSFVLTHPDIATFAPVRFFVIRQGQLKRGFLPQVD